MQKVIHNLDETKKLAQLLSKYITGNFIVLLQGDLGAGKTTFTKALGKAMGETSVINSPTFTILKQYEKLNHIDAYRLEGMHQDLGFDEILSEDKLCVVEWAQFIKETIPQEYLKIEISLLDNEKRLFLFTANGEKYKKVLEELSCIHFV